MSSARNGPSPPSNTPNRMLTPCRAVGLKRKSTGTPPLHANVLKKTKFVGEAKKCIEFDDGRVATTAVGAGSENKLTDEEDAIRKNITDKRREIEQLESELKNSRQHNLDQIQALTNKWLNVCQEALIALFDQVNENQSSNLHTIEDMIKSFGIDPTLIHFDSNTQEFY